MKKLGAPSMDDKLDELNRVQSEISQLGERMLRAVMQDLPTKPLEAGKRASWGIVTGSVGKPACQYDFDKEPLGGGRFAVSH